MVTNGSARRLAPALVICLGLASLAVFALSASGAATATPNAASSRPTIVLVHGDFADASSWNPVIGRLQDKGFNVVAPPNLLRGPATDAPYLASYLQSISGPIVLVAHSYGGFVVTNAATGNPNVKALVYIDGLMPDEGETAGDLLALFGSCVDGNGTIAVPYAGGVDLYLRWEAKETYPGFNECFANGVRPDDAAILFAGQRPGDVAQFVQPSGTPAWKTIPTWSLYGTSDNVIPPALLKMMSRRAGADITTVNGGHLTPITRPAQVTNVIVSAVDATT
jgi:pimeloyl-ACP methyl ester carboxylesterase